MTVISSIEMMSQLKSCRAASKILRSSGTEKRNQALRFAATALKARSSEVIAANQADLLALPASSAAAFRDRLTLDQSRIAQICLGLEQVANFSDPLAEVVESRVLENGLNVRKIRSPLGVIFMIFESRPNVAVESFSLALKSGNVIILRGGKESMKTTEAIYSILAEALVAAGLPRDCFWGVTDPDRKLILALLQEKKSIDVVVPRGGETLIEFVVENSKIPIIKNDRGLCHVFVNHDADFAMASEIVFNAKTQRPVVCNSMETLLVHDKTKEFFLPKVYERLAVKGVQWHGCPKTLQILKGRAGVTSANAGDWDTEYLDLALNCKVVGSLDEAIEHIEKHGSRHSEAIVTASAADAMKFESEVDAAAVYWNASTRFTDGFELGLGGELGISTQKLHVRGPVGLRELTSVRWIIEGSGQIRR